MTGLGVVTTPTFDWLAERARGCRSRMLVGSPYVNDGIIRLTDMVSNDVCRKLVTRTNLRDFAARSSDLDTLCALAENGVAVYSLSALHAKVYVFDDTAALVTSANATNSGMWRNLECGLSTEDSGVVNELAESLMDGLGAEYPPSMVEADDLKELHGPVGVVRRTLPELPVLAPGDDMHGRPFSKPDVEAFLERFTGWRRLTLEGILKMPESGFHNRDVLAVCGPVAAERYPNNRFVADQLRKQTQILRDFGIIESLGEGHYRLREG